MKRPKSSDVSKTLLVGVWHPKDQEYGGMTVCADFNRAIECCEHLRQLGYDNPPFTSIRIVERRIKHWDMYGGNNGQPATDRARGKTV
uniref:Uncharacterized protein n=1 Tax=viral metagenome TaxID=1070528 RepID=A0A6M3LCA7_9ZZZZ